MKTRPSFARVIAVASKFAPHTSQMCAGFTIERFEKEPWRGFIAVNAYDFELSTRRGERMGYGNAQHEETRMEAAIAAHIADGLNRAGIEAKICRNTSFVEFNLAS